MDYFILEKRPTAVCTHAKVENNERNTDDDDDGGFYRSYIIHTVRGLRYLLTYETIIKIYLKNPSTYFILCRMENHLVEISKRCRH